MAVVSATPQVTRPANEIVASMASWPHWDEVGTVVLKEYGVGANEFQRLLPEYQRFMALIARGYLRLGMFSEAIDKLWHSHILMTHRYQEFCETYVRRFVHHTPNIAAFGAAICETPPDTPPACIPETPPPSCIPETPPPDEDSAMMSAQHFAQIYQDAFGEKPGQAWNLPMPDGVAL